MKQNYFYESKSICWIQLKEDNNFLNNIFKIKKIIYFLLKYKIKYK